MKAQKLNAKLCGCGNCEDAANAAFKLLQTSVKEDNDCPVFIMAIADAFVRYSRELAAYEILDACVQKVGRWGDEAGSMANDNMDHWIDSIHTMVHAYLGPRGRELDHMRKVYNLARGEKSYTIEQYHEELHVQLAEMAVPGGDDLTPGDPLASLLAAILKSAKPN